MPGVASPAVGAGRRAETRRPAVRVAVQPAVPHTTSSPWRQISLKEQVLAQAPAEAAGYRLVLLGRDDRDAPRILPDPAPDGAMRFWRLLPFELPDDIRLRDGMVYRLLWVSEQGTHIPPSGESYLPGLHFFLGPPEPPCEPKAPADESARIASQEPVAIDALRDPEPQPEPPSHELVPDAGHGAELSQTAAPSTGQNAIDLSSGSAIETGPQEPLASTADDASQTAATQTAAGSTLIPATEEVLAHPPHAETAFVAQPVTCSISPEPTEPDAAQSHPVAGQSGAEGEKTSGPPTLSRIEPRPAPRAEPTTAPAPRSCVPLCHPPLTDDELKELTRIVLHSERCALFLHEAQCIYARRKGEPSPTAQLLDLGVDEQKRVRRVAQDTRLRSATADLLSAWFQLRRDGAEKMSNLPLPFPSITDAEVSAIAALTTDPERFKYAIYRHARFAALHLDEKLPEHPQTSLPPKERAAVRKLLHDARLMVVFEDAVRRLAKP